MHNLMWGSKKTARERLSVALSLFLCQECVITAWNLAMNSQQRKQVTFKLNFITYWVTIFFG